jgi:aconitate hydratase
MRSLDSLHCHRELAGMPDLSFYSLAALDEQYPHLREWPAIRRILLENLLRHEDGVLVTQALIEQFIGASSDEAPAIPFFPARILMQDYAGASALVDFAGLRDELAANGIDPATLNVATPIDLVVDHSLQVQSWGTQHAAADNLRLEYSQNRSRYQFLRWAEQSIAGLRIVPPGRGIVHQVNLEVLSTGVRSSNGEIFFDTLVGTDSHTPMVNGLGILGWGVGGIEALAVMLGQPVWLPPPRIVGIRLVGAPRPGVYAADVALNLTAWLRGIGVVNAFLEFHGPGTDTLSVFDKATIANMTPEYGATCSLFAMDRATLDYLTRGKRSDAQGESSAALAAYLDAQGMGARTAREVVFAETHEFDLSRVSASFAGPSRPDQVYPLAALGATFRSQLSASERTSSTTPRLAETSVLTDGSIAIAAITSCTNTANPKSMIAAGMVARRALELGLRVPRHVKCSFTPGSLAVDGYLQALGMLAPLERLGFNVAGYGCATCVGNSGELAPDVQRAIDEDGVAVVAVLSGNRNFESRIHPSIGSNFLMAPPLVVALAIAGRVDLDFEKDPLATAADGTPVYLQDLLPEAATLERIYREVIANGVVTASPAKLLAPSPQWSALEASGAPCFPWRADDSYFRRPAFLRELLRPGASTITFHPLKALLVLGDDVTTDHISPVGRIGAQSEAGALLAEEGEPSARFNTFGARRGNAGVMVRGTFDNPRIRNALVDETGPVTRITRDGPLLSVFAASRSLDASGFAAVVIGGRNYGTGSARDWAAKGQRLLGVAAVIAESFERIHRSNLIMLGIAPIVLSMDSMRTLKASVSADTVFRISLTDTAARLHPAVNVTISESGEVKCFKAAVELETDNEYRLLAAGGMLAALGFLPKDT